MTKPVIFETNHRASFNQIDPYGHLNAEHYLGHFIQHRFIGLREVLGWDLNSLSKLPVAFFMKSTELKFYRPVFGDSPFKISSSIVEFNPDTCDVQCDMKDDRGKVLATCRMELACIDRKTQKSRNWPDDVKSRFFLEQSG